MNYLIERTVGSDAGSEFADRAAPRAPELAAEVRGMDAGLIGERIEAGGQTLAIADDLFHTIEPEPAV